MRLYSYWRSSSSWRVRIGLNLKGLTYEYVAVNLLAGEQFSPEHRTRNPASQVPVLEAEAGGRRVTLVQSMAILEWLEERYPAPPLLPRDPEARAVVRALAELVNSGIQPLQNSAVLKMLKEKEPGYEKTWARHFITAGLASLERSIAPLGSRFASGDQPSLADCYLVPQLYSARRFGVDLAPYPSLRRIEEACDALPAFSAAHAERQPDAPPKEGRS